MIRTEAIQQLIDKNGYKTYLEIGVFRGTNFFPVKIERKIAVDPEFKLNKRRKLYYDILNRRVKSAQYFEMSSDDFFEKKGDELFKESGIDICFIDGMHEYQYAFNDVINTLKYLNDDGVIMLHDCNPVTREASVSFLEWKARKFSGNWNGDVWKAIVDLRNSRTDLAVNVIDTDQGLGIVKKAKDRHNNLSVNKPIASLSYEELANNRKEWLGLIDVDTFKNRY